MSETDPAVLQALSRIEFTLTHQGNRVEEVHRIVTGGSEPERGMPMRIAQLERESENAQKHAERTRGLIYTVLGGAALAVLGAVISLVTPWVRISQPNQSPNARGNP